MSSMTDRWLAVPEHVAYGYEPPELEPYSHEKWAVVDVYEDDPPICTTDDKPQAVQIADALNIAERVASHTQELLDQIEATPRME